MKILCFNVHDQRFAIPVESVDRVLMAQAITKIPGSPGFLHGIIDYYGEIVAVINLRNRFGLPHQPLKLDNRFIIAKMPGRKLAIVVDEVEGVLDRTGEEGYQVMNTDFGLSVTTILPDDKGIILIYDLEKLITNHEDIEIIEMIKRAEAKEPGL